MSLSGHLWTILGYARRERQRLELPEARPWATELRDPDVGRIVLTGRWIPPGDDLLVLVHGLGGCAESGYVEAAARAAADAGIASLSLNVRGADRRGEDFFHAALTADVAAAIASPEMARYRRVFLLGYSLGGHMALRYATECYDERLRGVVAVCPPLDLAACCDHIDRPAGMVYRRYLLDRLVDLYGEVAKRRDVPLSVDEARGIRTQREFDDRIVAPRHGFAGVDDYYRRASVGPLLEQVGVPALLVLAKGDPMVPAASLRPFLEPLPPRVSVRWVRGGHVGFPARLDLGEPTARGLESQALAWLARVAEAA